MGTRSGFSSSSGALVLALCLALGACGEEAPELGFVITRWESCPPFCEVNRVDVYVLKPLAGGKWCLLANKSFAPPGDETFDGLALDSGSTFRIRVLGFCGAECWCSHDDTYPVDPGSGPITIELERVVSGCEPPVTEGACP
jgi:hypothetical protein